MLDLEASCSSNTGTELSEIREAMLRNQLSRVKRKRKAAEKPHLGGLGISRGGKIAIKAGARVFTFIASFLSLRYSYIDKSVLNTNLNIFYYLSSTHALLIPPLPQVRKMNGSSANVVMKDRGGNTHEDPKIISAHIAS